MPTRPQHTCAVGGCPTLVRGRARCPEHTIERYKDPAQAKYYSSQRWKKIRSIIRRRDPICKLCNRSPTTNVDHIDGQWQNDDPSNLRGLCSTCDRKHSGAQHYRKRRTA